VVCGVWCVVCGVWCVVCGVWCVVCGVWCVVCGQGFSMVRNFNTYQLESRPHRPVAPPPAISHVVFLVVFSCACVHSTSGQMSSTIVGVLCAAFDPITSLDLRVRLWCR
jgi:hypothetical protein